MDTEILQYGRVEGTAHERSGLFFNLNLCLFSLICFCFLCKRIFNVLN